MSESKFDIEQVSLLSISVVSAALENKGSLKTIDDPPLELAFRYQLDPGVNIRSKRAQILADFEIRAFKSENEPPEVTSQYKIAFIFSINNLPDLVTATGTELNDVDGEMLASLLNIVYSTSRGILYTRFLGTVLEGVILPVISTADLNKQSAIKPIPTKK